VAWSIPLLWAIFETFQSGRIVLGVVFGLVCVLVLTTHYGLSVNTAEKTYRDYLSVFGLRKGPTKNFEKIHYLFVKKNKLTQGGSLISLSYSFKRDQYDGFIKFDEANKIHLATRDTKSELMKVLSGIAKQLHLEVVDYSDEKTVRG
jgi:hypothetical protein